MPRDAAVLRRGQQPPGLMVVATGLVKLSLKGEDSEKVIRLVGPGESFGEATVFLERPMQVDAIALGETRLVVVPAAPLLALVRSDGASATGLLMVLSLRLHELVAELEASMHGAAERLANYLGSLVTPGTERATARLPASKTVVAARLGITKETLSRLLRRLAEEGVVRRERRDIILLDRARLAALAKGGPPA